MSRINVEDSIWCDPRAKTCVRVLGEFKAMGAILVLWRVAQGYWVNEAARAPIPRDVYETYGFPDELLQFGIVFKSQDGDYFARGSKKYFDWIINSAEAGKIGGLASAEKRKNTVLHRDHRGRYATNRRVSEDPVPLDRSHPSGPPKPPTPTPTQIHNTNTRPKNGRECVSSVSKTQGTQTQETTNMKSIASRYADARSAHKPRVAEAMKIISGQVDEFWKWENFERAVSNYVAFHVKNKTEPKHVLAFRNFCKPGVWDEWVDHEESKPRVIKVGTAIFEMN